MSRFYYDLHIHSCLSPCGDNDMTPNNLVNMAALGDLDVIALTDHNSAKNCPAAAAVAASVGIGFIAGMELCTSEEIHLVCLFPNVDTAMRFDSFIEGKIPDIKNDPDKFGEQLILNENDEIIGNVDKMLITAADITLQQAVQAVRSYSGVCYPAHIDRDSYSVLAVLGEIPTDCGFTAAEITARGDVAMLRQAHPMLNEIPLVLSSDAHYLEDINPRRAWLELEECSAEQLLDALSGRCRGYGRG